MYYDIGIDIKVYDDEWLFLFHIDSWHIKKSIIQHESVAFLFILKYNT